jgi:16S rRNA (adenine(1408)-N(1))-methyltransferase
VIDLGAGDGRYVLARAAADPDCLIIGIDASAAAMADASRRAARQPRRGGLPNARFVVAAAEALPEELDGLAAEVRIHFPWGSLLRGLVGPRAPLAGALANLLQPGGSATLLVSVTDRDVAAGVPPLDAARAAALMEALADAYAKAGLTLADWRPAAVADVADSRSSWARRIGAGTTRPAWLVRFRRMPASAHRAAPASAPDAAPPILRGR